MEVKILSEMARVFPDRIPARYDTIHEIHCFAGESVVFQTAVLLDEPPMGMRVRVESDLAFSVYHVRPVAVSNVGHVPGDDDFLGLEGGLYPDFLDPVSENQVLNADGGWKTLYFACESAVPGDHEIKVIFSSFPEGADFAKASVTARVSGQKLPAQKLLYTRWFHCDTLADYYHVPVFSERHWEIVENFLRKAAQRGMNVALTPIHTPPLDTDVGAERRTVQLVDVTRTAPGKYAFGFEKLDRWVRVCRRAGIRYFEMAHLFSQWGLAAAPKIVARDADGSEKRIFGWDTPSDGPEYLGFLSQYLPALRARLKTLGVLGDCRFHISDEPSGKSIAIYRKLHAFVEELLPGCVLMDAMSELEFYQEGACAHPVPAVDAIEPFYAEKIPDLWTYYCCGQCDHVPNSFITMPGERVRALGVLMYLYDVKGFLQWGYNFYYGRNSRYAIDPYRSTDGDGVWPGGDPFIVYPSPDGNALDSLRSLEMQKALEDERALRLCEEKLGREKTVALAREGAGETFTFREYPRSETYFLSLREKIARALEE